MNYISYIKEKQKIWAKRNNIELIGSQNTRGERLYVKKLENNLYNNKLSTKTINEYENADGQEFGNNKIPGKMQALHSSSALVINVFEYWKYKNNKDIIAKLLNIPSKNIESIVFEEKFPILKDVTKHPNIDIVFHYKNNGICAIESKFTEPYGRKKEYKIEEKYLKNVNWGGIEDLYNLAIKINNKEIIFNRIDAPQLIKHYLGIINKHSKEKSRLIYLYYNELGNDDIVTKKEIDVLKQIFNNINLKFDTITYQHVFINLKNYSNEIESNYINYLFDRYL